ncbi:hypothetical protein [Ralstonia pseudosolanacearum]|uniref:Uncharacterized protein n=1 Tax=Ralstonia solanacearum TaxID=305 RepID=A0A0S4WK51_RALSL|nr:MULTISPECIES: hypothetical protein [Ralstonia]QVX41050.1 hypothetical protein J4H89_25195 [Ralstonia solanacearum]MCK4138458.1 hypothetical protein [Ralstonia pseudosolanacearum]MCK4154489.1 hypothetical protein [Ralstonia pseudosolanacearum]MDO3509318.1 hypothetical protein [Ralstonia pseudosolanacearum]MDO3513236.1 hypothetical protein [Ralstonia pseudosolanacearum]
MTNRSLRFEDANLQHMLISRLQALKPGPAHVVESDGTVSCDDEDYPQVVDVAHSIRDACFRWYFRWSEDCNWSSAFWKELKTSGTPFQVEHHDRRVVFLLPKGSEELHAAMSDRAYERAYPPQ